MKSFLFQHFYTSLLPLDAHWNPAFYKAEMKHNIFICFVAVLGLSDSHRISPGRPLIRSRISDRSCDYTKLIRSAHNDFLDTNVDKTSRFGSEFERDDIVIPQAAITGQMKNETNLLSSEITSIDASQIRISPSPMSSLNPSEIGISPSVMSSLDSSVINATNSLPDNQFDDLDKSIASKLQERGLNDITIRNILTNVDMKEREDILKILLFPDDIALNSFATPETREQLLGGVEAVISGLAKQANNSETVRSMIMDFISTENSADFIQEWLKMQNYSEEWIVDKGILNATITKLKAKYWMTRHNDLLLGYLPTVTLLLHSFEDVMTSEVKAGGKNRRVSLQRWRFS